MEFHVLNELHLPDSCIRLITQFLREPHPTAVLIGELSFHRYLEPAWLVPSDGDRLTLAVGGYSVRTVQEIYSPPYYRPFKIYGTQRRCSPIVSIHCSFFLRCAKAFLVVPFG